MKKLDVNQLSVKKSIDALIKAGTTFDMGALEKIYHNDLKVMMIGGDGQVVNSDKLGFKNLFESKKKDGSPPLNTWSKLHQIDVKTNKAHVLISRKVELVDQEQNLILSIDLVKTEGYWQVMREVIFIQPINS